MSTPDRAALFPYLGGRGFAPMLSLAALSAAAASLPAVLMLHRSELAIDLELSRAGTDRFVALVLGATAIGALVGSRLGTARIARIAVQVGGAVLAAAMGALAALNETQPLRVALLVAGLEAGLVWSLTRTVALDLCGNRAGWRVVAMPWAGAALGVVVVATYDLAVDAANWGYELGGAAAVAFLAAMVIPPARAAAPETEDRTAEAAPSIARGPILLTAFLVGAATIGAAPTAWDLLSTKWALERSEVAASVVLVAGAALVISAIGHWFGHQAERTPRHLASASQVLAAVAAALVALGAASVTEVGALLCWAAAAGAAVLFAVSAETALLAGRDVATRVSGSGLLVAATALGAGASMAVITTVHGVSRGWLIVGASAPALVVAAMSVLAEPKATEPVAPATYSASVSAEASAGAARPKPLLVCRGIEVSYGNVQVLFGVDLCVEEGQIVALLGTNGAGKTTLLRTIAGLETQHAGSIHFAGADISTFEPTWRVGLGINQIAGGQALAEDLTVAENLRLFGHSLGRNRAALHAGIDRAFEVFPRLAERRNQAASTLSGGEKQMLALSKALILRPRLLIIDEFSLGLAPKVVGELLPVVSDLNRAGTAVLLVEQSVNIALSMASYASCMEKGAIVFEGPADTLRDDPDLMRSVYLEGVTKALAS